jgi:signal transduction histidine kinase
MGLNGKIWVKHGLGEMVSCLDGYEITNYPSLGDPKSRLLENRFGQVWTTFPGGIARLRNGHWEKFSLPDLERENHTNAMRRLVTPVPLVPIYSQLALFALPDLLMCFDPSKPASIPLKAAAETGIGLFTDIVNGHDDVTWIAGTKGMARFRLSASKNMTLWEEFVCPEEYGNLQHLSVDDHGGVTAVAEQVKRKNSVVAYFDNGRWEFHDILQGNLHYAWVGPENRFWACTIHNLGWLDSDHTEMIERESQVTGWINDVATDSKGVFWLATSEGLARFAPAAWRTPPEVSGHSSGVIGMVQDLEGRLWFATDSGLLCYNRGQWKRHSYVDSVDPGFQPTDEIVSLSTGEVVLKRGEKLLSFNPTAEEFSLVAHPSNRNLKLLGQLRDGALCLQTTETEAPPASRRPFRLESYDGKEFRVLAEANATRNLKGDLYFCLETTNRDLWIGGSQGVGLWRNGKIQTFSRADGQVPESALCMLEMPNGRVWCGGVSKIYEYDHQRWSLVESGFDRVNCLMRAQDGTIWAASNDGVYRYLSNTWLLNNTEDGLPSSAAYELLQDDQGTIWVGTARGLSRWHPDSDIDAPRAFITSHNGQNVYSLETPISLSLRGRDKWKYTSSNRLLYSTRIDGEKWTDYNSETTIPLKDTIPGKHRFEARVMDRNGNVDIVNPAVFEFTVILPWYLESRLIIIVTAGLVACLLLAALAINRHWHLKKSYAQVELIVEERTRELNQAHEALLHSQKMQALGAMSAGIAHDFNNILSIIKGSVQIIEEHLDNKSRVLNRLDRIKTMVDQGASVVKALLGYSRTQSREMVSCDINPVVDATLQLLGDRFATGIVLRRQLQPGLPEVFCIKDLLQQILLNLILNAAEAMAGEGKILIVTALAQEFPANGVLVPAKADTYVTVAVQDNGCGINEEIRSRIFEPFFTTKALSTRRGTGLGLSMVYEFARTQGLGVYFDSEVGRGSNFMIYLPVNPQSTARPA